MIKIISKKENKYIYPLKTKNYLPYKKKKKRIDSPPIKNKVPRKKL